MLANWDYDDFDLDSELVEEFESFQKIKRGQKKDNPLVGKKNGEPIRQARKTKEKAKQAALEEIQTEE